MRVVWVFFFLSGVFRRFSLVGQLLELQGQGMLQTLLWDAAQHHPVACRMWPHAGASLAMLEKPKRAWGPLVAVRLK